MKILILKMKEKEQKNVRKMIMKENKIIKIILLKRLQKQKKNKYK